MAKWKRSGADALREYEQSSSYAKNIGAAQMQQQEQTQSGTWKRSGADALREYEQSTNFPQTMRQRQYNAEERNYDAFANYRAAMQQQAQRQVTQGYERRADAMGTVARGYGQSNMPTVAKKTAYENYTYALKQKELRQKQMSGKPLTPAEQKILNTNVYKNVEAAAAQESGKLKTVHENEDWREERKQKRKEQLSEQEFNRSGAMQEQYGSYDNYLRGVYAGYDEAVAKREAEQAKSSDTLRAESADVQRQIAEIDARQRAAWTQNGYSGWDADLQQEKKALQEQRRSLDDRAYWKGQEEYKAGRQAERQAEQDKYAGWTAEQMQARIDEIDAQQKDAWTRSGASGYDAALQQEKKELERQKNRIAPGWLQKAGNFADDALTAFYEGGNAQSMSGFEMAHNVAETKVNQGVAWALRDIADSAMLHALGGDRYAEKLRSLADRMATEYDYTDAQLWQDDYNRIMDEVLQDHSPVGTWILQQLPSAGAMVGDLMVSTATGGALTPLTVMGIRAGGNAMLDAHNAGATDTQAVLIGLQNAAVEIMSEKLFGGNPVYDEDVGLVNRAVAKLTKSKTVMKVLDSKAFDFVSEGLEEVIAEILEPTFQSLVLNGSLKGSVTWESLGNSFLGGVFLAALGDLAGMPGGLTQAKQERQTKYYAKILAGQGAQSENTEVREAAAIVQEKLDYGRTPDIEDIGRVLSAMDDAGETQAAQEAAEAAQSSRAYNQYEKAVEDVQQSRADYDRNMQRKAIFDAEAAGEITHERAEAALDVLDNDEAINRGEADRVNARKIQEDAEAMQDAANARERLRSQQERADETLDRQTERSAGRTVQQAAAQYGWTASLTDAVTQGYTAYIRRGGGELSAAQYAEAVNRAYQYGASGAALNAAQRAAQGVQPKITQAAWAAGKENGNGRTGKAAADDGGKRDAGMDSGKQSGSVAAGTGRTEARSQQRSAAAERADIENRVRNAKQPYLSGKEIGIKNGSAEKSFQEVPESLWTPALRETAEHLKKNGVKNVHFFVGKIGVVNQASQVTRYMNGVAMGDSVWVRANDNRLSVEQIGRHEEFHNMADRAPDMLDAVREQITKKLGKEKLRALARRYAEAYEGCYTEEELAHYIEEICADAYAGIERFGGLSKEAMDALWQTNEKTQSTEKTDSARAPPEGKFSLETSEDGRKYVLVDRQQGRFIGLNNKEAAKLAKEIIQEEFSGQTLPLGEYAAVTVRRRGGEYSFDGAKKYAYDGSQYSDTVFQAKMRAAANLDEMLEAAEYVGHSDDHKNHAFATDGFDYYKTTFVVGGRAFEGVFNIGLSDMGATFYGMTKIEQVTDTNSFVSSLVDETRSDNGDLPKSRVARNVENVNGKFSADAEQEAQEQTEEQEVPKGGYTLNTIPKRAQTYLRRAQNDFLYQLERSFRMPFGQNVKKTRELLDDLTNEYLQTGDVTKETMDKTFEKVYEEGVKLEKAFYEKIERVAPQLRMTEITLSAEERAALENYEQFKRRTRGKLNVVESGGKSLSEVYEIMSRKVPELFPRGVTDAAEQEMLLLMGANRMATTKENVRSYNGKNAAVWKRTAQVDFEANVREMMGDLRVARRYAEAQKRTEKVYEGPTTEEDVQALYNLQADQRRNYEREAQKYLLTAEDRRMVNRLLRGDITPESVAGMENADSILAVYEAKADYDLTTLKIAEYNKHINEQRDKNAQTALGDINQWKDKKTGFQYARETQTRNVRDIAPKENAEAVNKGYFEPVRKATANATRMKNDLRARVKALKLSRHRAKGNIVSEAAAVQILGEAQDNIRVMEASKGRIKERDGKTLEEWEGIVSELWNKNPGLEKAKIQNAVKEFRKIYDELYKMMNATRIRNGYAPVNYRAGYFPHFGIGTSDGILNLMGMAMGVEAGIEVLPNDAKGIFTWWLKKRKEQRGPDALPTTINGQTKNFRPGIPWLANAQERKGFRTAYDAVKGFDKYVEGAASVIYYTDVIQNLRALARNARYLASNDGIKEQIDAIRANENLTEEDKKDKIDEIKREGRYALSLWVANVDEYTNLLANKKSTLDRDVESLLNRSVHSFLKKWQTKVAANMVALNPGSWLTNFGVIAQAAAQMKITSVAKAMYQQAANAWVHDDFAERSDFLTSRAGSDTLVNSWADNASKVLSKPMELIDWYSSNVIVRARYMENIQRGMSEESAMEEADDFAAGVMADRSKGAMPTLFESRNPLLKMFTQFQLEVNNTFSYVFKDLPAEQRKKGVGAIAWALLKFALESWIYNEFYELVVGRRPMLDPIDLIIEGAASYSGHDRNNAIRALATGQKWWTEKDEDEHWLNTTVDFATEIGQELPFVGNLVGGGKLPYTSTFPDIGNMISIAASEDLDAKQKTEKLLLSLKDPAAYWVLPFGGGQIKKSIEGAAAAKAGGSYKMNSKGERVLQYPVYTDTTADKIRAWTTNIVFGKSSTKAAQDWVESGFKNLNAKETTAYETMTEYEDQRETFAFIKAVKKIDGDTNKKIFLGSYKGVSDKAKADYFYNVIANDTDKEEMEPMTEKERIAYMEKKIQDAKDKQLKESIREDFGEGKISEQKAIQKLVANDFADDENDAYWKIREWKGGKGYKKYDSFLSTVESAGDVAKAAKEYLDNGVEAETLAREITSEYKQQYIAADSAERKRLKKLLLDAYAAIGYDRKEKEKDIDKWLEDDK